MMRLLFFDKEWFDVDCVRRSKKCVSSSLGGKVTDSFFL